MMENEHHNSKNPFKHKESEYLLTTSVGKISRKVLWNDKEPMALDHPPGWIIEKYGTGFRLRDISDPDINTQEHDAVIVSDPLPNQKNVVELPNAIKGNKHRPLDVDVIKLSPIKAPHLTSLGNIKFKLGIQQQLFLFHGIRYFLAKYRPIGKRATVRALGGEMFSYERDGEGYRVVTHQPGIKIKIGKKKFVPHCDSNFHLTEDDFFNSVFIAGIHWWRFKVVASPDSLPPLEEEESEDTLREKQRFQFSINVVVGLLFSFWLFSSIYKYLFPAPPKQIVTQVEIKAPKVIPHKEEPKVVEVKPPPPPLTPPPKLEKVVEKVVKKKDPPPKRIVKKEPLPIKPKPSPVVRSEKPPAPGVVAKKSELPPPPSESEQLMKSLSFLSSNTSKPKLGGVESYNKSSKKDFTSAPSIGGGSKDSKVLDHMASSNTDANITTKSSRSVSSDMGFSNKGLNQVQGKIGKAGLYNPGGKAGAGLDSGAGLSLSGPGHLSESEIEKALSKFLSRFQYCYEKALLSDSSLSGIILIQWTITEAGRVNTPKVLQSDSAMKSPELHSCLLNILKEVPFPKPKGGSVTAKKPFKFSSTTL